MRLLVRALIVMTVAAAPARVLAARANHPAPSRSSASSSLVLMGAPGWTADGQPLGGAELGFAPLSVTQSGVTYSPAAAATAPPDSTTGDESKIADLPAWASTYFGAKNAQHDGWLDWIGLHGFGAMSGPVAWVLVMIGVALIGGALRGLIVANRRLNRLRSEDDDLGE